MGLIYMDLIAIYTVLSYPSQKPLSSKADHRSYIAGNSLGRISVIRKNKNLLFLSEKD